MGVPALVALGQSVLSVEDGAWLVLDAEQGTLTISPDQVALAAAEQTLTQRKQRQQSERAAAHVDCRTADGERIEVFANLGSIAEAQVAVAHGAEGCGLLRTEFLFLERDAPPSEDEQLQQYQGIARALENRPLVIRTLDIGGDKPIPICRCPPKKTQRSALRGVRTSLWRPDLLRVQLRAILRVQPVEQCRVLLPMITDPAEIRAVRRMLDEVRRELGITSPVQVGAMIETPASAVIAGRIAREVDFLSIGTNDLTQYTLAMDRGHAELAHRIDGLHPAVLNLIAMTVDAAARARQAGRGVRRPGVGAGGSAHPHRPRRARAVGRAHTRTAIEEFDSHGDRRSLSLAGERRWRWIRPKQSVRWPTKQ